MRMNTTGFSCRPSVLLNFGDIQTANLKKVGLSLLQLLPTAASTACNEILA